MKKQIKTLLGILLISIFLLTSCFKSNHSIRIKNSYSEAFSSVSIGNTSYGRIEVGATTAYKPIDEGSFTISGSTNSGKPLSGSGSVSGKGTHKWTMTITSAGGVSISEDK